MFADELISGKSHLQNQVINEEKKLEMMISGGDYSPNSHTFFKHPFAAGA